MFSPSISADDCRSFAEVCRQKGDMKGHAELLKQAEGLDKHMKSVALTYKEKENNSSYIKNRPNNHFCRLTDQQWKICTIISIIALIALSAIIIGLEYYGFLYRR